MASSADTSRVNLPPQYVVSATFHGNSVRQLLRAAVDTDLPVDGYTTGRVRGLVVTQPDGTRSIVVPREVDRGLPTDSVLLCRDVEIIRRATTADELEQVTSWLYPAPLHTAPIDRLALATRREAARASWTHALFLTEETVDRGVVIAPGLRKPQIGAIHAALAHWTISDEPGTIVMPTGTGKTEAMLALLVSERPGCLLITVPTDALRDQIGRKFLSLGLLKNFGVVATTAHYPLVGILRRRPQTAGDVDDLFKHCNVIVATMAAVGGSSAELQNRMAELTTHLFIDEAHHVAAATWVAFKSKFAKRRILQFTATPFRRDRQPVEGKALYTYPLRNAQAAGYFMPIRLRPVAEFSRAASDRAIAAIATKQLVADLANGYDHLLMARTDNIGRAEAVLLLYRALTPEHNPVVLHTGIGIRNRRSVLNSLVQRKSRIVVCVDMLGEGFDLPNLKIAALHDMHASLAVTLQFTGRFTRTQLALGTATVVANVADAQVEDALRELYAEDADWNILLRQLSDGATRRHRERSEFIDGFGTLPVGFPIHTLTPKMSTVAYRTACSQWTPDGVSLCFDEGSLYSPPVINARERVAIFLTREVSPVPWAEGNYPRDVIWHLYVLFWDKDRQVLFINSSNNDSVHEALAAAVVGPTGTLVRGEAVFRVLHGIGRLALINLGLKHSLNRVTRFTMYVGSDVLAGLEQSRLENFSKTNLFGIGYERGARATVGCSLKGRIWSYLVADDVPAWMAWCRHVGDKLVDTTISTQTIFQHVLVPETITTRPPLVPLVIEWPDEFLFRSQEVLELQLDGERAPYFDCGLELTAHAPDGPLAFRVIVGSRQSVYEARFGGGTVSYDLVTGNPVTVVFSRKRVALEDWLRTEPPIVRFEDSTYLDGNQLFRVRATDRQPFRRDRVDTWDWTGVDLRRESQTWEKHRDAIQRRVIDSLIAGESGIEYNVIMDDDGSGEVADVVALKAIDDTLVVHLFHCKYSAGDRPGSRIDDLYAVCGQAQKSVPWKAKIDRMLRLLGRRDETRKAQTGVSRFEKGDRSDLVSLRKRARYLNVNLKIFVVQPGMSAAASSEAQLELLAVTAGYLKETYAVEFGVIASP